MAQRADRRAVRPIRRVENPRPGRYFLVHSDQLYSLEPVEETVTYAQDPEPMGPMGPMEGDACALEPAPKPSYGPGSKNKTAAPPTGFFLDRYVY
jgi:hypothetical protein